MRIHAYPIYVFCALLLLGVVRVEGSLVAHYTFDEAPGTGTVFDSATNFDGTVVGSVVQGASDSILGSSIQLTGGHVSQNINDVTTQLGGDFTIAFWFKPTVLDQFDRIFESSSTNAAADEGIRIDLGPVPGNNLRGQIRDGTVGAQSAQRTGVVLANQWQFGVVRFTPSSATNPIEVTLLQQGLPPSAALVAGNTDTNTTSLSAIPVPHSLTPALIGAQNGGGNAFRGYLDQFYIFNEALSDAAVADLYLSSTLVPEPSTSLLLLLAGSVLGLRRNRRRIA